MTRFQSLALCLKGFACVLLRRPIALLSLSHRLRRKRRVFQTKKKSA